MKTNGATWKAYLASWPSDQWFDDSDETINGTPDDDFKEEVPDDAVVEFNCGVVYANREDREGKSLTSHFRAWERSLTRTNVVCEVPKDKLDDLVAFLKTINAKVK